MRAAALVAALLWGCGASQLEDAKWHRHNALAAQSAGDVLTARAEMAAAIEAAEASLAAEEGAPAQAWLLKAWGHLALGQEEQVRPALAKARTLHRGGAPAWQQRVLVAAHCQIGLDNRWWHYAALCFDHLLSALADDSEGLHAFAAEGLANADSGRKPGYAELTAYGHPLFVRLLRATKQSPMNGDLLAIFARRLSRFCRDPAFTAQIKGWRVVRSDLHRAAKGLDAFTTEDRRKSFERDFDRAQRVPLCPALDAPPSGP